MTRHTRQHGLTLIELTVTLAIVSMLTATSLAVVAKLSRIGRVDAGQLTADSLRDRLTALLSPELVHIQQFRNTLTGFTMDTLSAIDPKTMQRQHRPITVAYDIVTVGERRWLVRRQTENIIPAFTELVARGISDIHIQDATSDEPADLDTWARPLVAVRVTVTFDDERTPPLDLTLPLSPAP